MKCECGYEADSRADLEEHITTVARSEVPAEATDHAEARSGSRA